MSELKLFFIVLSANLIGFAINDVIYLKKENDMGVTNIEKIKNATNEEMLNLICRIKEDDGFFSDYYCSKICKHRTSDGCPFDGEDDSPCTDVTWKDEIREWLEAEVE